MSVIIRLQNLPWSANALDIRQYFHGLSIPEGGVHIVGGEQGDAFIAFSTDEDARQAMMADGGKIKEVKLKLLLSSRAEMQKVIETARQQTLSLQNFMNMPAPQQATPPLPAPHPPTHMMGATAVVGHLHLPPSPAGQQHVLSNNIPAQHSPVTQAHPLHPAVVHPHHPVVASGPPHTSDKKDSDRRVDNRGEKKRERSRSRSRERRRNSRDSRDKDRDRHRGSRRRSRSRSRDRRRRDRSRDRSRSRDRRDRRRGDKDNSSKDNKDKQNGNDVVVVGQFPGRSGSKEERPRSSKSQPSQPPMVNGVQPNSANVANAPGWSKNAVAPGSVSPPSRQPQDHPANMPPGGRMLGNFPPGAPFPFPNTQDHEGWIPPRHPGMVPPQGRFDGGFRGGPPGRPRPNRFEDGQGPPEFPHDGPFPPRGRDRPPFEDGFRGGGHRGGFNPRDNPRGQRSAPHTCVEIRNVPTSAAYRDIREFFQGMHVLNIKMINDEQGRKTGIAYIKFTSLDQKEAALSMNGMTIHDSHLEVLHLDDQIYDDALDSFHPNAETHIVALHNLPPYANEQDIRRLFQGARILNIVISRANSPRSPQAYVQFSTQQEGRRAIQASGKLTVDGKEIFVERSSIETLLNSKKLEQDMGPVDPIQEKHKEKTAVVQQRKENSSPLSSDVVLLKNLPLNVNDRAILDFFSDVGLVPQRIHIMLDKTNSPFGDAFCEFLNVTEGARALAKHNNMLGNKEITVKTVSRHELEESLGIIEQKRHEETKHPLPPQRPPMPQGPPRNGLMPPSHPGHMGPMAGPPMRGGHMGEFMGRGGRGGFFGDMRGGPHMRGHRGMHHGGPPMMVRPPHPQQMLPPPSEGPTLDTFGTPGCVIELQNVPYKAEIEEIIEYFNGFDVTPANIIRRYNDAGLPTGDARISFRSPAEAQRALEDLKYKTMRDRPIYMSII